MAGNAEASSTTISSLPPSRSLPNFPSYSYPLLPAVTPTLAYPTVATRPVAPVAPAYRVLSSAPVPVQQVVQEVRYVWPTYQYQYQYVPPAPAPEIVYVHTPPQIQYVQSPPQIQYVQAPPVVVPEPVEDPAKDKRIAELEAELAELRLRMKQQPKQEVHSRTSIHETYKVKTFEIAARLAVMDGTDDGMYNGLPIEVEGEGLYKDLVAKGRRPKENVSLSGQILSSTTSKQTYKVQTMEMAEKLSKMDGTDDGKYNDLPIEVAGLGLYTELRDKMKAQAGVASFDGYKPFAY